MLVHIKEEIEEIVKEKGINRATVKDIDEMLAEVFHMSGREAIATRNELEGLEVLVRVKPNKGDLVDRTAAYEISTIKSGEIK